MSFAELKKARAARQPVYARANPTQPSSVQPHVETQRMDSKPYDTPDGLFATLGESFEIRVSEMGRGIYVKADSSQPIGKGNAHFAVSRTGENHQRSDDCARIYRS